MLEAEMTSLSSPQLRHQEASYFCSQFIAHCGPPSDSYFHMVCYFDAFLFALVSVEEMVDGTRKVKLKTSGVFRFMKALRNISAHHSVLAASQLDSKFIRPFARHLFNSAGGAPKSSGKLAVNYGRFRAIFDAVETQCPREKPTLDAARAYLTDLETRSQPVFLEHVLEESLSEVKTIVA